MRKVEDNYAKARKRVANKKGFYSHLGYYGAMIVFFFLLNAVTFHGEWWFIFPALGWGIGVLIHYLSVFGLPFLGDTDAWEEKEIRKEMERLERRSLPESFPREEDSLDLPELKKQKKETTWDENDLV
ncbi:MAG: hypothetical protein DHS20C18_08190 [Saprospiraceae bacterium]|nr:MAG: hypothetical protein DHS20C18_08190 [Saprospiraceae bacterium]